MSYKNEIIKDMKRFVLFFSWLMILFIGVPFTCTFLEEILFKEIAKSLTSFLITFYLLLTFPVMFAIAGIE